jgi:hypothetical protein
MLNYLRRRWNRLVYDGGEAAANTTSFVGRAENLLIAGGILAVATGIVVLVMDDDGLPVAAAIVLGLGLLLGAFRRRLGWLLTAVALILLVLNWLV